MSRENWLEILEKDKAKEAAAKALSQVVVKMGRGTGHKWTQEYYGEDGNGPPVRHCLHCGKIYSLPIEEEECAGKVPNDHGRTKYLRTIRSVDGKESIVVDVYCVINAYAVTNPAIEALAEIKEDSLLGCWCHPKPCHCEVIIKVWKELRDA